ncbi:response regulator [Anoxynatronum buryatiense]|uniref:Transcriptional regulatory protein n=1 Tax=Anoxynatronum buryatiense TaxID=489973 RepID=A0AA46AHY7_9CLOT|nr:response regulator [Anoxynatronum buryatiense]SMP44595.1 two-component system, CitB family, response regulator DctR [Anoxynatronum buryatiense]
MIRVMIVEDDPMVAEINHRYVSSVEGFQVAAIARNGEQAMEMLEKETVDLMILDIYMPRSNGLQLLKKIRNQSWTIDVILVTASQDPAHIGEVLKLGAFDYLVKPFEFKRLKQALENYRLRKKTLENTRLVSQNDIDRLIISRSETELETNYEKGIHPKTLATIKEHLLNRRQPVDATQVADDIGVARVTARRYLEYLVKTGFLELDVRYDTGGRPRHLYHLSASQ